MGLGHRWPEIARCYAEVNQMFGDIVKVTPSSKVVGDMALFLFTRGIKPADVVNLPPGTSFPASVIDMLSGGLTGGKSSHPGAPGAKGNNVVFIALDPERFVGMDALVEQSGGLARYVRATPRAEGVAAILLPGDPERMTLEYRSIGGIPLEEGHWAKLTELAASLGVPVPELPPAEPARDPSRVETEDEL